MANVQLNVFPNFPNLNFSATRMFGTHSLWIQAVYIPGSISFKNVIAIMSASGTTAKTASLSFGLYSLNASTLSLANSAFWSSNPGANATSWITLSTSAAQNITPGIWYFGFISNSAGNSRLLFYANESGGNLVAGNVLGGPFVRGVFSASTSALPASIATSDMNQESTAVSDPVYPYIIITA